jgi:hypothetical protein
MRGVRSVIALGAYLGLALGSAEPPPKVDHVAPSAQPARADDGGPARSEIGPALVEELNETCPDVWCEGPYNFWFHDADCDAARCVVRFTARMGKSDWLSSHSALPEKKAEKRAERAWTAGGSEPVLEEFDTAATVLVDGTLTLEQPIFEAVGWTGDTPTAWGMDAAGFEKASAAIDAWEP